MPASAPLLRPVEGGADVVGGGEAPELRRGDVKEDADVEVVGVILVCVGVRGAVVVEADILNVSTAGVSKGVMIVATDLAGAVVDVLAPGNSPSGIPVSTVVQVRPPIRLINADCATGRATVVAILGGETTLTDGETVIGVPEMVEQIPLRGTIDVTE